MPETVRVTEADLRAAMRDERYWRPNHPERAAFQDGVACGYRGLNPTDGVARELVWVSAYSRNGHDVQAHWRSARASLHGGGEDTPDGQGGTDDGDEHGDDTGGLLRAARSLLSRAAPDGRGSGGARPPSAPGARRPARNPRHVGEDRRDRVNELREDPANLDSRALGDGVDQWDRPGGVAQRDQDLQRLGATGRGRRYVPELFDMICRMAARPMCGTAPAAVMAIHRP